MAAVLPEIPDSTASTELVLAKKKKKRSKRKKKRKAAKSRAADAEELPPLEPFVAPPIVAPEDSQPQASSTDATVTTTEPGPVPEPTPMPTASVQHVESDGGKLSTPASGSSTEPEPRDVELRLRKLADKLASQTANLSRDARYLRFAVLPFDAADAESKKQGLGLVISDIVATTLLRDHRLALVERSRLKAVLDEMALQQTGITDDSQAAELGKIANADVLIVGQVTLLGDSYKVSARMIETETAKVAGMAETELPSADLVALSSKAVVLRSKADAAFRSAAFPGWGQHYNQEPTKGWIFTGVAGSLLTLGVGFEITGLALWMGYYQAFTPEDGGYSSSGDPKFQAELQGRKDLAGAQFLIGNVLLGTTAVVWAYNIADAYLSGVEGSEMIGGAAGD